MAAIAEQTVEDFKAFVNSDTFEDFRMLYYAAKGEFPKTVGDVLDAISDKTITPRDLFDESFNSKGFTEEQEDYWLSNLDLFDYDCYYPPVENSFKQIRVGLKSKLKLDSNYTWQEKPQESSTSTNWQHQPQSPIQRN